MLCLETINGNKSNYIRVDLHQIQSNSLKYKVEVSSAPNIAVILFLSENHKFLCTKNIAPTSSICVIQIFL